MQAAAVEILRRPPVELAGFLFGLRHAHELQETGAVGVPVLAEAVHLPPEAVHGLARRLVAVIGQVAIDVVHAGAPLPRLDRAAAGDPHRRVRLLHRARPYVDVALAVEAPVEREGVGLGPRPHHQVVGLVIAFAEQRRVLSVGVAGIHGRADREAGDQAAAGDAVDHREFFGDPRRRVVEGEAVAHDAQRRPRRRAARQGAGDQIGRRHQPVAVRVVLVAAHRIQPDRRGVFHFVHEVVVHPVRAFGLEQARMDVYPHRRMFVAEILRQLGIGHEVKPQVLHGAETPFAGQAADGARAPEGAPRTRRRSPRTWRVS